MDVTRVKWKLRDGLLEEGRQAAGSGLVGESLLLGSWFAGTRSGTEHCTRQKEEEREEEDESEKEREGEGFDGCRTGWFGERYWAGLSCD